MSSNGIRKARPATLSFKSSDRRQASGRKAASYLLSQANLGSNPIKLSVNVVQTGSSGATGGNYNASATSSGNNGANSANSQKVVKRSAGGKTWEDPSLLEWDPKHFRLFVGNLGQDADEQMLFTAFSKYPTMSKVKIPMDKHTNKNKGYGFVAFADADDYFKAFQEMNGKYIGLHPVQLKRAETKIKPTKKKNKRT